MMPLYRRELEVSVSKSDDGGGKSRPETGACPGMADRLDVRLGESPTDSERFSHFILKIYGSALANT